MATKKKSPKTVAGAGSVLSSISGPSTSAMPTSLGGNPADTTALLEKIGSSQNDLTGEI